MLQRHLAESSSDAALRALYRINEKESLKETKAQRVDNNGPGKEAHAKNDSQSEDSSEKRT